MVKITHLLQYNHLLKLKTRKNVTITKSKKTLGPLLGNSISIYKRRKNEENVLENNPEITRALIGYKAILYH